MPGVERKSSGPPSSDPALPPGASGPARLSAVPRAPVGPEANPAALRCANIHRFLGTGESRVHVLRGVSFEARRGRVYAIVGPSGCGKSTLLYLLGLLDRQDEGDIWIDGRLMSNSSDAERTSARGANIGFVFQFHFLMQEFTSLENVMMPMRKLGRLAEAEMQDRATQLLTAVGLGDKTHRLGTQLSGGEQQRVAIARALANAPAIILADEPTGNLDLRNSGIVFDLLTRLAKENGQAVILVTHNAEIASRCDAVHPMRDGLFI
jgi:lipoprotein-releasing system ATP-binding protein